MATISAIELKVGNIIKYKANLFRVLKTEHVKPGKGGAFMQVELKGVKVGTKLNERFRSDQDIEKVMIDLVDGIILFITGDMMEIMNNETYDQFAVAISLLSCDKAFLEDNMPVKMLYADEELISVTPPPQVICEIQETQTYIKGQTVKSSFKPALLTNGLTVQVPDYIENGTKIIVNTDTMEYIKRAE